MYNIEPFKILFNMKSYLKYILVIFFTIFSFYYTDKVIELSNYNDTILASINDYAKNNNTSCIEGTINENGIVLGLSGIEVDKNKSYSNMKGIGFKKDLIEYKENKCILNKIDNLDKYIISGNNYINKISIVIDIDTLNYYEKMINIFDSENSKYNLLVNINNVYDIKYKNNILFKTNSNNIKEFKKIVNNFYCVKYYDFNIIDYCKKEKINSINKIHYIDSSLLLNTKKILDKGIIIFIKENNQNLIELNSTIKYIKSRGYEIVSIDELLS